VKSEQASPLGQTNLRNEHIHILRRVQGPRQLAQQHAWHTQGRRGAVLSLGLGGGNASGESGIHDKDLSSVLHGYMVPAATTVEGSRKRPMAVSVFCLFLSSPGPHLSALDYCVSPIFPISRTRPSRSSRSRALCAMEAARSNSARASSLRPSLASRSPLTLGSHW
jgi:hypothetical protein